MEVINQGGTNVFDFTVLNRAESLGGVATNPDTYTPSGTPTSGQLQVAVKIYNASTASFDDPTSSVPSVVAPTLGAITYGGSTGYFTVLATAPLGATLSTSLPTGKYWAILWTPVVNGKTYSIGETFTLSPTGSGSFGTTSYCTAAHVASFLQTKSAFSTTTKPTLSEVNDAILRAQDEIDWYTHHSFGSRLSAVEYYDYNGYMFSYTTFGDYISSAVAGTQGLGGTVDFSDRGRLYLRHRNIRDITTLQIWDGSSYVDWLATKTEGRGSDYFVIDEKGCIMFGNSYPFRRGQTIRIQYTYGEGTVPRDVEKACIRLAAAELTAGDDRSVLFPEGTSNIPLQTKAQTWKEEAYELLARRREMVWHS